MESFLSNGAPDPTAPPQQLAKYGRIFPLPSGRKLVLGEGKLTRIIKGPIIGWDAPKAFVSDMGFFTMPQLILAAAIGGSEPADVLCGKPTEKCPERPEGSIEVPESVRRAAAHRLIKG